MSGREAGDFLLGHARDGHGANGDVANDLVVGGSHAHGGPLKSPQSATLQGAHGAHAQQRMAMEQGMLNLSSAASNRLAVPSTVLLEHGQEAASKEQTNSRGTAVHGNGSGSNNSSGDRGQHPVQSAHGSSSNGSLVSTSRDGAMQTTHTATAATAAIPLSDKAKGKARAIEREQVPLEVLEAELIPEEGGTVELKTIVQRVANYGFEMLQTMGETLPSLSSEERRAKIFTEALSIRKEFIKLLVIAQWAKIAPEMQRTRDLVTLISDQFRQPIDATDAITQIRRDLPAGRMRSFDLETAIDVLALGAYTRAPTVIKDSVVPPEPFTDQEALIIVRELEDAIRRRLAYEEVLPAQMTSYRVTNGRAHFRVPGYFEAAVTLSGASADDRWYFLTIRWDLTVTGPGAEVFPRVPRKARRAELVASADQQLEPQSLAVQREEDPLPPDPALQEEEGGSRKDMPLMRLFSFLQERSLHYQLDVLHFQAVQLSKLTWGDNLRLHLESDPRCLVVQYWAASSRHKATTRHHQSSTAPNKNPLTPGSIRIYVDTSEEGSGIDSRVADLLGGGELDLAELHRQQVKRKGLKVQWSVDPSLRKELGDVQPESLDPHNLDFKSLLLSFVPRHSAATLRIFQSYIVLSALGSTLRPSDCVLRTIAEHGRHVTLLLVQLHPSLRLVIGISEISGRVFIQEVPKDVSDDSLVASASLLQAADLSNTAEARLAAVAQTANEDPRLLVEGLQMLRLQITIEHIEQRAAYLELSCLRNIPLSDLERSKFGQPPGALLWIPIAMAPSYYLVPQILPQSLRVALVLVGTLLNENNQAAPAVQILGWLNRERVVNAGQAREGKKRKRNSEMLGTWGIAGPGEPGGAPFDVFETRHEMSIDELARLYSYSEALVSYFKVEQQLRMRDIPFVHVDDPEHSRASAIQASRNNRTASSPQRIVEPIVPILCVRAASLLDAAATYVHRNVSVRLREWWIPQRCRVEIAMEMKLRSGIPAQRTQLDGTEARGSAIEFDVATSVLTFSTHDVDNAVGRFLVHWKCIARMAALAREVVRARRAQKVAVQARASGPKAPSYQLRRFDLKRLEFSYSSGLTALVCRADASDLTSNAQYLLKFGTAATDSGAPNDKEEESEPNVNPHQLVEAAMQRLLNAQDDSDPLFWTNFLKLLADTLPVLRVLSIYHAQCLEDALCPEVEVLSATWYRLRFLDTSALDISVLEHSRILFTDASQPRFGMLSGSSNDGGSATTGTPNASMILTPNLISRVIDGWKKTLSTDINAPTSSKADVLNLRRAVLCVNRADVVRPILETLVAEVKKVVSP